MTELAVYSLRSIVADPVDAYVDMHRRLQEYGPNAPFPEFKPAVDYIVGQLANGRHQSVLADHPALEFEQQEVDTYLAHVNLKFTFDDEASYPYGRPFEEPFPYRPTIDAIESGLRLLDKSARLAPGSKAVPLYHFDRYAYHRHSLIADPDAVLLPTPEGITYEDFIRTRAVPIGFIGVAGNVLRVDRHQQSPLDFWYHDINHVRRMVGYLARSARRHGASSFEQKLEMYRSMDEFIQRDLLPTVVDRPQSDPEDARAVRRLSRLTIYEILHESALAAERDEILGDLLRPPIPQPFEHMVKDGPAPESTADTEKLRTPTGNLQSGVSTLGRGDGEPITIRFFHDRALALLANVYNKLNFGFYDDPNAPSAANAPVQYRTPEYLLQSAHEIMDALRYTDRPSDEYLLDLINSREGSAEKFLYQPVAESAAESVPFATEPLAASSIVKQIKGLGKNVITLFGFSYLGYQDPEAVMAQVRQRLADFDPNKDVINIGATEEGIGGAYRVAHELGFTTIGLVSTLALTYSGRFSEDVDRIYIVNDERWGGYVSGTDKPVDTTEAYLRVSDQIHAFGGGENTAVALTEAHKRGIPISYTPADMNHAVADKEAGLRDLPADYRYAGAAQHAWAQLSLR